MPKERHKNIVACYLIFKRENQILLLKRKNTGYRDGEYSVIAGHVEQGETFRQAMIREAKEEAGIEIKSDELKLIHTMHEKSDNDNSERVNLFFMIENYFGEIINNESEKCEELNRFNLSNLPENIVPQVKKTLQNYKINIFYSEHGW